MPSPPKQKKITSLSFSDPHMLKDEEKKHYRQFRSHQQQNKNEEQKSMQQKATLNKILSTMIQEKNQQNFLNQQTPKNQQNPSRKLIQWQLMLIDQKRTMMGIKVRVKCKLLPNDIYVVLRLSFTIEYFRLGGKVQDGTVFVQLDEINFDISKTEKKNFQLEIQKIIKSIISKTVYGEDQDDNKWVKELFDGVQTFIQTNQYHRRPKKSSQYLNRKQILTKYMLYHPPACVSWSPKGLFCLTQNRVPASKSSFIATPLSFKQTIDAPKVSHLNTVNEEQLSESLQQPTQATLFSWDMQEELQLLSLSTPKRELSTYYKDHSKKELESKKKLQSVNTAKDLGSIAQNGNNLRASDTLILEYASKLTPTIRKIYERYFSKGEVQYDMARGEKLNVYFVCSENRRHQDDMIYLMQKIAIEKSSANPRSILQIVLSTLVSSYPTLLAGSSLDTTKYFVLGELIRQQRSKSSICPFSISLCLKSIILQNQYHSQQLAFYLIDCFRQLGVSNAPSKFKIYDLGSYMHFDQYKAQKIVIKLLEQYEYHYELNTKTQKEVRFILQSKLIEKVKKHIKIKSIVKFPPIKEDFLISQDQRKTFTQTILPILIIRDRNHEQFYYRQLQRIITTNQKVIKFYKNLAMLIKKVEEERHDFIRNLISEYYQYEDNKKTHLGQLEKSSSCENYVRREFIVYCQKCQRPNRTFEIADAEKLKICTRCQDSGGKKA